MRSSTSTVAKGSLKVNASVEVQSSICCDINIQALIIGGGVDQTDLAGLDKVVGHDNVFLVGSDLDVVGANGWLDLVGVVEALDIVQIGYVEGGDVVGGCEG
jgi:hypothetical protein